jgi:hypothetical protein
VIGVSTPAAGVVTGSGARWGRGVDGSSHDWGGPSSSYGSYPSSYKSYGGYASWGCRWVAVEATSTAVIGIPIAGDRPIGILL